jgi:small subunit ribosomal protein S6
VPSLVAIVLRRMARLYDLMLMLDPNAPEERQGEIVSNVRSRIESAGTLVGVHDWGTRRMTFEIDHRPDAAYHLFQFEGEKDLLDDLDHNLKITDGVLRFRIIRLKPGSPPPPSPRPAEPRREAGRAEEGDRTVAARSVADAPAPATESEPEPESGEPAPGPPAE